MQRRSTTLSAIAAAAALIVTLAGCSTASSDASAKATASTATTTKHVVTTDEGKVTVPANPKKVVVLNYALAGYLYDLNVPVTATIPEDADQSKGTYSRFWSKEAKADKTKFLPWSVDGFDLESILAEKPDLIIGGGIGLPLFQAKKAYKDLTEIAPTVLVSGNYTTWQQQYSFLAKDVFQNKGVYKNALATYKKRAASVAKAITPPKGTVSFLAFTANGTPYGLVENIGLPTVFTDVGMKVDTVFADNDFKTYGGGNDMYELSTEQVGQVMTQRNLFVLGFNGDYANVDQLKKNAVYSALPAFKDGNVHKLPYWTLRGDYDEALATLSLIKKTFS